MTRRQRSDGPGAAAWRDPPATLAHPLGAPTAHKRVAELVVSAPEALRGRAFPLAKPQVTLGRSPDTDITIDDPHMSRHHAMVGRANGVLVIEDTGSRSGVAVNGLRIARPTALRTGDRIALGTTELSVRDPVVAAPVQPQTGYVAPVRPSGIPPMRRSGRRLLKIGFALFVLGLIISAIGFAAFASSIVHGFNNAGTSPHISFVGWAVDGVGGFVAFAGVVTMIVSAFMRRRPEHYRG